MVPQPQRRGGKRASAAAAAAVSVTAGAGSVLAASRGSARLQALGDAAFLNSASAPSVSSAAAAASASLRGAAPASAEESSRVAAPLGQGAAAPLALAFGLGLAYSGRKRGAFGSQPTTGGLPRAGEPQQQQQRASLAARRGLQTGIVGLPNVGKSTLFNALCDQGKAQAANFPFCTIDPNVGKAAVPDKTLKQLGDLASSEKVIPEFIEYVDIAGLVKGASKGEGLGNKFLGNIRTVDAIVHVVRCFEDDDIIHVDGSVDPVRDIETINLELIFSDLDQVEKKLVRNERDRRGKVKGAEEEKAALLKVKEVLEQGKPARLAELTLREEEALQPLGMITKKKVLYAANVAEEDLAEGNKYVKMVQELAAESGDPCVTVSAAVEAELSTLEAEESEDYLESLGVTESGCDSLVKETYGLLGLRTYYTCGPQESRAWTIQEGWKAPKAAGVIHTDFEKGFIKAETISYVDLLEAGSEDKARKEGKMRIEGKEYVVQEGDVMHFRFNV